MPLLSDGSTSLLSTLVLGTATGAMEVRLERMLSSSQVR